MIPNEIVKSDSEYEVLNGTSDPRTGVAYPPANCSATSIPSLLVHVNRQAERINAILAAIAQGRVVQEASLTVGIWPINYRLNGVSKQYDGASAEAVTDDETNYLYLDADNALVINTTGFPVDPATFLPLAQVICENGSISEIVDCRPIFQTYFLFSAGDGLAFDSGEFSIAAGGVAEAMLANAIADAIPTITLAVGDETGDAIAVTIQAKDIQGNNNANRFLFSCWLSDAAYGAETATGPDGTVSFTTGTLLEEVTASKRWLAVGDATGKAILSIGHSTTGTWYLNVAINGRVYASSAITFA